MKGGKNWQEFFPAENYRLCFLWVECGEKKIEVFMFWFLGNTKKFRNWVDTERLVCYNVGVEERRIITMITVKIDEDVALDMLMDRLSYWTDDTTTVELFRNMYKSYLDERMFDGDNFNVIDIVDDDYFKWCSIIEKGDNLYNECKSVWDNCERCLFSKDGTIEAEANGAYLVRWKYPLTM